MYKINLNTLKVIVKLLESVGNTELIYEMTANKIKAKKLAKELKLNFTEIKA